MRRCEIVFCMCLGGLASAPAEAANPQFQDFFFDACADPTGALAARCGETQGAAGDLSGDSESSLNPSQTLSSSDGALAGARARSKEARERVERYRAGSEDAGAETAGSEGAGAETAGSEGAGAETAGSGIDGPRVELGPFSLLVNGRWEWEERDREVDADPERGFDAERRGIEVGLDRRFSDTFVAGLLYAYEDGTLEFDAERAGVSFTPAADAGSIDREAHNLTLFGLVHLSEHAYLEANAGYAVGDYRITRNAVFQESTRSVPQTDVRTRASTDGEQFWLGVTTGYQWHTGATSLGVYAGALYAESSLDGYREQDVAGSGLALVVDDIERDALTATLGLRAQRTIGTSFGILVPQIRIEYEHAGGVDESEATVRFALDANETRFALAGSDSDDYFNVGVSFAAIFPNGWISFADVEALAGARDREQYRFTVGIRKEL